MIVKSNYDSVWDYLFSLTKIGSKLTVLDNPIARRMGYIDEDGNVYEYPVNMVRDINNKRAYLNACKKYNLKPVTNLSEISSIVKKAIATTDGRKSLVEMINDNYFSSDFGKMNEALK